MLLYWFLPAILFIGIMTSYEDIKTGRIRNKLLLFGLIYVFILYNIFFFLFNPYNLQFFDLQLVAQTGLIGLAVGFVLWFFKFWTAGDAKLFFVYVLLIPPTLVVINPLTTLIDLLINTFIPVGLYLVFSSLERTSLDDKMKHLKKALNLRSILIIALLIFVLLWPAAIIAAILATEYITFVFIVVAVLIIQQHKKLYSSSAFIGLVVLAVARLLLDPNLLLTHAWKQFLIIFVVLLLLRIFLNGLTYQAFTKSVPLSKLKKGMVAAEVLYKEGKSYKKKVVQYGVFKKMPMTKDDYLFTPESGGLSNNDIKKLKSLSRKTKFKELRIQETISFAPFLFVGIILQIVLGGNVLTFLRVLIDLI